MAASNEQKWEGRKYNYHKFMYLSDYRCRGHELFNHTC